MEIYQNPAVNEVDHLLKLYNIGSNVDVYNLFSYYNDCSQDIKVKKIAKFIREKLIPIFSVSDPAVFMNRIQYYDAKHTYLPRTVTSVYVKYGMRMAKELNIGKDDIVYPLDKMSVYTIYTNMDRFFDVYKTMLKATNRSVEFDIYTSMAFTAMKAVIVYITSLKKS